MELPFLKPQDARLRVASAPVPVDNITAPETQANLERLFAIAQPEQADRSKPVLMGLAASQIGIPKRIILIDIAADGHGGVGDLRAFINPVIMETSLDLLEWYEGCYSTGPLCGIVKRPRTIVIQAYNTAGQPVNQHFTGYVARVFQHEIDHLDGHLFVDRITNDDHLHHVETDEFPRYRDQEGWRTWPKKYPRHLWEQINPKI
jgi:peptide deformylase